MALVGVWVFHSDSDERQREGVLWHARGTEGDAFWRPVSVITARRAAPLADTCALKRVHQVRAHAAVHARLGSALVHLHTRPLERVVACHRAGSRVGGGSLCIARGGVAIIARVQRLLLVGAGLVLAGHGGKGTRRRQPTRQHIARAPIRLQLKPGRAGALKRPNCVGACVLARRAERLLLPVAAV